jgi:predicted metal-binding membrane protein
MISPSSRTAVLSCQDRIVILASVGLLTALAWTYLFHLDHQMSSAMEYDRTMAGMGMTMDMPWKAADVWFTFGMWTVMMVGMMLPAVAPMMLLVAGMNRGRERHRSPHVVVPFSAGYLLVWTVFSAGAAVAQWALHQAAFLSPAMTVSGERLSGALLIAAGVYQLTPLKGACLTHCRSPLGFLLSHWQDGAVGGLRMGVTHGIYCLGCCWALMCVLFVVGVMNLVWVAVLTIVVIVEKMGPAGAFIARVGGAGLIAAGALIATAHL